MADNTGGLSSATSAEALSSFSIAGYFDADNDT
jgi:hypothetical protein